MDKLRAAALKNVDITGGFWLDRDDLNRRVTIYSVYNRFSETGRFDALRLMWRQGMDKKPHIFWDSDVAKWIEAAAYIIEKHGDERLEKLCDEMIDRVAAGQTADGYFNSYFQQLEPSARFTRRVDHELYCCGHFIEAAVAYFNATGKRKLLNAMCRYADLVEKVFVTEHSASYFTPGHEEIELALVKLWHCTGEKRYLELSKYFLDERGKHAEDTAYRDSSKYELQDYAPVREMSTAEGHAVRACYLYSAMADIAYEYNDGEMLDACKRIFDNISHRRMYITGGIGSSKFGEAFTLDWDLPNKTAYTETCAAISLAFFAHRMTKCDLDSKYGDVFERVIYNAFPAGVSLDGSSFFYSDPIETTPRLRSRNSARPDVSNEFPKPQRSKVFDTSCCPPNITRFTAGMGEYIYFFDDEKIVTDQFVSSKAEINIGGKTAKIETVTEYPKNGNVCIKVENAEGKKLFVRIPGWCTEFTVVAGGKNAEFTEQNGYAVFDVTSELFIVEFNFEMSTRLIQSDPRLDDCAGKYAVMRGPVVYCVESVDNGENIHALLINADKPNFKVADDDGMLNTVIASGRRKKAPEGVLYFASDEAVYEETEIKLIPYYCIENRGECEMCIWLNGCNVK